MQMTKREKLYGENYFTVCFYDAFIIFKVPSSEFTSEKHRVSLEINTLRHHHFSLCKNLNWHFGLWTHGLDSFHVIREVPEESHGPAVMAGTAPDKHFSDCMDL